MLDRQSTSIASSTPVISVDAAVDHDPIGWITDNFVIPETGKPITLHSSQSVPLEQALTREDGKFIYSTVLWSAIKKSAKSSIAAAVGMWFAFRKPFSSVKVLGNDLKQAESRVYEYMRRAILLRPDWRETIKVNNYKIILPNQSVIEAIPIDPTGEAGGNDDLVLYTELWGWKSKKHQLMWTESTLSPTKYGESLRWCESYAGYSGESPVLETLYTSGVKEGRVLSAEHETYVNDAARLFVLWNTQPKLSWQTDAYYAQEAASLTPNEFRRVHHNDWSSSVDAFVPIEWWDACQSELPPLERHQPIVVALDAAVSGDCFAIVGVSRVGETVYLRFARKWTPPPNGKIQYSDPQNPDNPETPEGFCRWIRSHFNCVEFAYDEYQLHDFATRMMQQGIGFFNPFSQGADRLVADKELHDIIRDQRIVHDGNADVREHVQNANRKAEGEKLRIIKRVEHMKIDLCVATSMAANRAKFLNIG